MRTELREHDVPVLLTETEDLLERLEREQGVDIHKEWALFTMLMKAPEGHEDTVREGLELLNENLRAMDAMQGRRR